MDDLIRVPCPAAMITAALARATMYLPILERWNQAKAERICQWSSTSKWKSSTHLGRAGPRTTEPKSREFLDKSELYSKSP